MVTHNAPSPLEVVMKGREEEQSLVYAARPARLSTAVRTEAEIQAAYCGTDVANRYVERRFIAPVMSTLHERQVTAVNEVLQSRRPTQTLEIAPGPGRITRYIEPIGELTCLEFNSGMIDEGRRACRDTIHWVQGNAFDLPLARQFDVVYSFRFVRHFEDTDRARLYRQIVRVLRPGGVFLMDAVNERVSLPLRRSRPEEYSVYDKLYADINDISAELAPHDLILQSVRPVLGWFHVQSWLQTVVGPRCDWVCRRLIRMAEAVPSTQPLEWIVQCRRA